MVQFFLILGPFRGGEGLKPNFRGRHGGVEKGGGWKTSRMTPLPKRGFGPPLARYVFHPPQASALCFSYTKIHDRADQKLFWRGPKIFGRARSLVRFPPPIRFAPPHITAQKFSGQEFCAHPDCSDSENRERKKPINIKNFGGTPPGVRPVCPGDTSHLSRDMSRLSRGHSVPLVLIYT